MELRQSDKQNYPPDNPYEDPENYSGFIIVQLSEEYMDVESKTLLEAAKRAHLEGLLAVEALHEFPSRRLIRSRDPKEILELEAKAQDSPFPPLFSLVQSWRLDVRQDPERILSIINELRSTQGVDWVYPELQANDPDTVNTANEPDFSQQGYLQAASAGGIDAVFAWTLPNGSGTGVRVADIEQGWDLSHVEFLTKNPTLLYGDNHPALEHRQHGTAVLGILIANDNAVGGVGVAPMKGVSPAMEMVCVLSHYQQASGGSTASEGHVADAIAALLPPPNPGTLVESPHLNAGDILLIEVERGGSPSESEFTDWAAIRLATAHNIIVVEAAGNEGVNLDGYGRLWDGYVQTLIEPFNRSHPNFFTDWDSGAVLVGAADWDSINAVHSRSLYDLGGSNYGGRIDCFSWGNNVVTIDYNDSAVDAPRFNGTSAAAAIIAGAATLLQSIYRQLHPGQYLSPQEMRSILSNPATSLEQEAATEPIGVMPDLQAILTSDPRFQQ